MCVGPVCGGGVTFGPDIYHEGLPLLKGKRRVIAIFTDEHKPKSGKETEKLRDSQRQAALYVFGRLKKT